MLFSGSSMTGQVPPCSSKNSRASSARVVEGGADEHGVALGPVRGVEGGQLGVLLEARHAPAGEEVEHHPPAALVGDVETSSPSIVVARGRRGDLADAAGSAWRCSLLGVAGGEHGDQQRDEHRDHDRREPARCAGGRGLVGRRRRRGSTSVMARPPPTGSGTVLDRDGRRHRVGGPPPAPAGPGGQHRAEGHHAAAHPQPQGHRLDDHAERDRVGPLLGKAGDGEVHVLGEPGLHRRRADERSEAGVAGQRRLVHLARRRPARAPWWPRGCAPARPRCSGR